MKAIVLVLKLSFYFYFIAFERRVAASQASANVAREETAADDQYIPPTDPMDLAWGAEVSERIKCVGDFSTSQIRLLNL